MGPPSVTVVGEVAALADRLGWLAARPLDGRTVAVTRARAQASGLAARLRELGAEVVEAPAIRIAPLPGSGAPTSTRYDLVCLTSPNGVRLLFERLAAAGRDARSLAARGSPRSGRGRRGRCTSTAWSPTWCPSASWPRDSSRR